MKPKLITTHVYTKRPNGECVYCKSPREAHAAEYIIEDGQGKQVAIQPEGVKQ